MYQNVNKMYCDETPVYRGLNYDLGKNIGEKIMFKSWLSTSKLPGVAVSFSIQGYDNP